MRTHAKEKPLWQKTLLLALAAALVLGLSPAPMLAGKAYAAEGEGSNLAAASLTGQEAPAATEYSGTDVSFINADNSAFGMWAAQEGTKLSYKDGKLAFNYLPKNKTVYSGFYLNAKNDDSSTWNPENFYATDSEGNFVFELDRSYAGKAWPVAPVKKSDGASTSAQVYLAIPPLDKIEGTPTFYELSPINNEKMYVVVKVVVEDFAESEAQDYLTYYLNGSSYDYAFSGSQDDAVATFSSKDTDTRWAAGKAEDINFSYVDSANKTVTGNGSKLGYRVPITISNTNNFSVPIVAYASDFTARRFDINLTDKTATTGSASDIATVSVTSSVDDISATAVGSFEYTGYVRPYAGGDQASAKNPLSNDFVGTLSFNVGSDSIYDRIYAVTYEGNPWLGTNAAVASPKDSDYATIAADGSVSLPIVNEYDTKPKTTQLNGNIIKVMMHVKDDANSPAAGMWVDRQFKLDFTSRTAANLAISGLPVTSDLTVTNNVSMFKVEKKSTLIGSDTLVLAMSNDTYTKAFVGDYASATAAENAVDLVTSEVSADSETYTFSLPVASIADKQKVPVSFMSSKGWFERLVTLDREAKTLVFDSSVADYAAVETAQTAAEAINRSLYTDDSLATLDASVAAVVAKKFASQQVEVDAMAKAINDAIAALVEKDADYTAVNAAKAKVPANLSIYTDATAKAVKDAVAAVKTGKKIGDQAEVDAMAKAINDAVAALAKKAEASITVADVSKTYGDKVFALGAKLAKGDGTLSYKSSNAKVATVDAKGNVTIKGAGETTITVSAAATGNFNAVTATAKVTVAKAKSTIKLAADKNTFTGKKIAYKGKVTKTGSTGAVTYKYYSDKACKKQVKAANVKNAGTYYVKATVAADANYAAATSAAANLTVNKKANTLTVKAVKATQTARAAKTTTIKAAKAFKVTKNVSKGAVTYKKAKGDAKIKVAANGKITVAKGLKKGKTYTVTVKATSKATTNYKAKSATVTLKIKVK